MSSCRSRASAASCTTRPRPAGCPSALPLTIDYTTGFYLHREGPGLVFGGREPELADVAEHGAAPPAAARRAPGAVLVVGLLRDRARTTTRWSASSPSPGRLPVRHRLLGPRVPAGAGGRRAPGRADRRTGAVARPLARSPSSGCSAASRGTSASSSDRLRSRAVAACRRRLLGMAAAVLLAALLHPARRRRLAEPQARRHGPGAVREPARAGLAVRAPAPPAGAALRPRLERGRAAPAAVAVRPRGPRLPLRARWTGSSSRRSSGACTSS